jgi:hypothetical protein
MDMLELASSSSVPDDDRGELMETEITIILTNEERTTMNINNAWLPYASHIAASPDVTLTEVNEGLRGVVVREDELDAATATVAPTERTKALPSLPPSLPPSLVLFTRQIHLVLIPRTR